MAYGIQMRGVGTSPVGSGVQYTTTDIVITPTAGDEILTNGDLSAWTGDNPDSWTVNFETGATKEVTERDSGQSHADTKTVGGSANFFNSTGGSAIGIRQDLGGGSDPDYYFGISETVISAHDGSNFALDINNQNVVTTSVGTKTHTYYHVDARYTFQGPTICDVTLDSVSFKPLYNLTQIWEHVTTSGDYSVVYTRASNYQVGLITEYQDELNFSILFDNGKGSVVLVDVIDGTASTIGTYAAAYSAGKTLTLVLHEDGTRDIVYNNVVLAVGIAASGLATSRFAGVMLTDDTQVTISSYAASQGFLIDNIIRGVYASEDDWYIEP